MSVDMLTGRLINQRIIIRNGVRKDKPFSIRWYNANEIRDALNKTGLQVHRICADWDGKPLSTDSRRMAVIAKKPACD